MTILWRFLVIFLPLLVYGVSAVDGDASSPNAAAYIPDYFLILVGGIVLLILFLLGIRGIMFYRAKEKKKSRFVILVGSLVALLLLTAGSLFFIGSILALLAAAAHISVFAWLEDVMVASMGSLTFGILGTGGAGLGIFLLGVYLLVALSTVTTDSPAASPTRMSQPPRIERDLTVEALNPRITLKVFSRSDEQPVPNARVILKQMNGTKFYTKTTNTEGEVTFDGIVGYSSDYHAYVDGDESREKFRVIRTQSAE
jgi:hypothetical protein